MKIRTKVFYHSDVNGKSNLENENIILVLNGKPTETKLRDVFTDLEFDDNEIYGNSLLSFYTLQEGNLVEKGSLIQLVLADTLEPVIITSIDRPVINDDSVIPFEHVQKFVEFFKLERPEEVFFSLSEEEKSYFTDQRKGMETTSSKEKEAEDKKKEQELKASIDPKRIINRKEYLSTQAFYRSADFKEYINGPYHLFHGDSVNEGSCMLIKRGADWWEESPAEITEANDKTVVIEFKDGEQLKNITLDIATNETTVSDTVASE